MKKEELLAKLEEGATTLRMVIEQYDGSTIKAVTETVRQRFDTVKGYLEQNETAQKTLSEAKKHYDELGVAVEKGDKELTAKLLAAIERKIMQCKEKTGEKV